MKLTVTAALLSLVLAMTLPAPAAMAQADPFAEDQTVFLLAQGKKKLTEAEAAKQAQKQYGGKVLSVTCREKDERVYCSVRLDIDGRIKTVTIRG